jgi:hypothetical protein
MALPVYTSESNVPIMYMQFTFEASVPTMARSVIFIHFIINTTEIDDKMLSTPYLPN